MTDKLQSLANDAPTPDDSLSTTLGGANCHIVNHPLVQHNVTELRDVDTAPIKFRRIMHLLSSLLCYEAARDFEVTTRRVATPLETTTGTVVAADIVLVSILRSGTGMMEGMLQILPFASMGHIGIYHDRFTENTIEYYFRLPKNARGKTVLLVDPFIGSGKTATAAIERLREYDVGEIRFVSILASPEGVQRIHQAHPDVIIYTASLERGLDSEGYLVPGVGDAGERLYGSSER